MANYNSNVIISKTVDQLKQQIKQLKRTEDILRQDNKALMNDNTRLRKEKDIWMKKSHENLRLSFNKGG